MENRSKQKGKGPPQAHENDRELRGCSGYLQLRSVLSTVEPLIPSVKRDDHVYHLQPHVSVEPGSVKYERVQADIHNCGRPAPDVLLHAEIDADDSEKSRNILERVHVRCLK